MDIVPRKAQKMQHQNCGRFVGVAH